MCDAFQTEFFLFLLQILGIFEMLGVWSGRRLEYFESKISWNNEMRVNIILNLHVYAVYRKYLILIWIHLYSNQLLPDDVSFLFLWLTVLNQLQTLTHAYERHFFFVCWWKYYEFVYFVINYEFNCNISLVMSK